MFKTNFSGRNKIWGVTKYLTDIAPEIPPWLQAWSVGGRIVSVLAFLTDASAKLKRGHMKCYVDALCV